MLTRKMLIMWIYQLLLFSCAFYHKVYATDEVNCKTCPKGYGVVFPCNITANTICEACPPGTYSDVESVFEECRPCSRCGKGLYEMHPCTGTSDTFCELCSWQEAVPNDDYNIKCKDANLDAKNQNLKDKSGKSDEEPDVVAWLGGEGLPLAESLKGHDPAVVSGQEGDTGPSKLPEQPVDKPAEPDADAKVAQQKDLTPNDKNAKEPKGMGVSVFSITMVALSVGVVFFVIGFAVDRWRHRTKHPTDQYELAAETPSMPAQEMVYRTPIYTEKNGVAPATIQEETELTPTTPTPITSMGDTQSKSQSPINIDPEDADPDVSLGNNPLLYKYVPGNSKSITNTGSTIRLDVDGQGSQLSGGPFSSTYEFHHIDFKWGSTNEKGSEHTVNGVPAAAEVQLVHWNCKDYKSYEAAEKGEDGLAVLSVLFKVGRSEHTGVKKLTDCLPSIQFKGESRELPGNEFDPASLLPDTTSLYWTYLGSTTTQPYHESVTWVIFKDTLEVTTEQIDEFRKLRPYHKDEERLLKAPDNDFLADNFRSVQPLGDRTVRASFV